MYEDKKFDVRLIERHLINDPKAANHITKKELEKHLKDLPDVSDKCEKVTTAQPISSTDED